ncbi:MAG: hypothetical protein H3C28_13320 [Sphingomonadales bacterium]|nr:hypothetical protein [Sphingomonadales bacterium]
MTRKRLAIALAATTSLVGMSMVPVAASAQSVEQLQQQIDALQAQINEMKETQKKAAAEGIKVKWEPAPKISSADGRFEMNLRGRIFVDAAWISDDDNALDDDATEFRAARLGIEGKAWNNVKYKFEADFADNEVEITDAIIGYDIGVGEVMVGNFKTFNSLEELTSSRFITFMERGGNTDAFSFERQLGVGVQLGGENWSFGVGAQKGTASGGSGNQGETISARATFAPKIGNNGLVHLGAHYRYRKAGADESLYRYRQRPHQHLASTRLVSTPSLYDNDSLIGLELAGVFGPFSAQGEYMWIKADRAVEVVGFDDPTFNAWYADVSWFLTGESRAYKAEEGSFNRVKVKKPVYEGGFGAWQVGIRYDVVDLIDENIFGGKQKTWIFGVNWHLNDYSRIMMNYSKSDISDAFAVAANGVDGENGVDAFGMRFQVDW